MKILGIRHKKKFSVQMPLLNSVNREYWAKRSVDLTNHVLLAVQHLQGSTVPLLDSLLAMGIEPHNAFIIGKAYSSHPSVVSYLQEAGFNLYARDAMLSPSNPYECEIEKDIEDALDRVCGFLRKHPEMNCLILDEGGKAIRRLHESNASTANKFICVEQTTRGIKEIEHIDLLCPVINVARSKAKREYESPLIGQSMFEKLREALSEWQPHFSPLSADVFVIGYGVVGKALSTILAKNGWSVVIGDTDRDRLRIAENDGHLVCNNIDMELSRTSIVVGCTGKEILNDHRLGLLRSGILLVNGASSDIEFSAWRLRANGEIRYTRVAERAGKPQFEPWRNLYRFLLTEGFGYLANGGFPINFNGDIDPIAPEKFQITRALMYGAACQAVSTETPGLWDLDDSIHEIVNRWYKDSIETDT